MKNIKLAIIGLGYVGLPLAIEFSKKRKVVGYDISSERIEQLQMSIDTTNEVSASELKSSSNLFFTNKLEDISTCNFYIVTVPTPITTKNKPDFKYLINASKAIGTLIKPGNYVIFESTVYPGATREVCIPVLEKYSGLKLNKDFFVGYSPERINPGDKNHRIGDIVKVVAGSNKQSTKVINSLYKTIISAGTYQVSSIEVAEAAKVIENTQRDLNIALVNELSLIFHKMNLDTEEIINAASTKWNFAKFLPGFVGGHCIGVDPYYLTHKAKKLGYNPRVILSGRALNDDMPLIIARRIKTTLKTNKKSKILILGFSFKENCPDIRNTKINELAKELTLLNDDMQNEVDIHDPLININKAVHEYPDINFVTAPKKSAYDAVIVAVGHRKFKKAGKSKIKNYLNSNGKLWDLKYLFNEKESDFRL